MPLIPFTKGQRKDDVAKEHLARFEAAGKTAGVLFVGPHDSIDGSPATIDPRLTKREFLGQAGAWRMYRVWQPGHLTSCVGR